MSFVQGMIAGYGIAIPVGAIAILIIGTGLQRGFRLGFMAGAGAATADLLFALLAAALGHVLHSLLLPFALPLRFASGLVLVAIGIYGLSRLWRRSPQPEESVHTGQEHISVYRQFLALTLLNPLTIGYFGALILGGGTGELISVGDRILFVLGAGMASLSWQTLLAAAGAFAGKRLAPRWHLLTHVAGHAIIAGLGLNMLVQLTL